MYVTFDGDYEYLQKVLKKLIFDHLFDFFNLVSGLEKSRIIENINTKYEIWKITFMKKINPPSFDSFFRKLDHIITLKSSLL